MNKTSGKKIIIICAIIVAALIIMIIAGLYLIKNRKTEVKVFPMSDLAMDYYWGDTSETNGMVETRNMQSVYLSETQTVSEIFVSEGQTVKKGDKLASFDTTLTDIGLERQRLVVEKTEYDLENAKKEYNTICGYRPYVEPAPEPEPEPIVLPPQELPLFTGGDGTEEHPFIFIWNNECMYTENFINSILPASRELPDQEEPGEAGENESGEISESEDTEEIKVWSVFEKREYDNKDGALITYWGISFKREDNGSYSFSIYEPSPDYAGTSDPTEPDPVFPIDFGPQYTASEIAQMKAEKQKQITDLELQVKVENVKLEKLKLEMSTGIITANLDGVIKTVLSEDEARMSASPIIVLSGGGGYYIEGTLSELELDTIQVGQTVTVVSWMNNCEVEGEIIDISEYPSTSGNNWTNGNNNVSFYPFTVFVNEDASLQVNDYVSIRYSASDSGTGIYLEKPFILEEGSKKYVYVEDVNGFLEKREIVSGKYLWDSYIEVVDGLTMEDYVAFPYGKNIRDGAIAIESGIDVLYSEMY